MSKTKHMQQRMSQRAIQESVLDIVKLFGVEDGDKIILNRKGIDDVLNEFQKMSTTMQKMRSRGGIVLVESHGIEITTYALDSHIKH